MGRKISRLSIWKQPDGEEKGKQIIVQMARPAYLWRGCGTMFPGFPPDLKELHRCAVVRHVYIGSAEKQPIGHRNQGGKRNKVKKGQKMPQRFKSVVR